MHINLVHPQVGLFIFAWFLADIMTPVIIRFALRIGAVDVPHSYKIHKDPIPFLGGVAIYLAFSLALFSILRFTSFEPYKHIFAIVLGGFFVLIIGLIDDFRPISAVVKLIILIFSTILLSNFGINVNLTGIYWIDIALTVLWIAGVTSALNSLDNMDGAACGVGAVACFWTFVIAWYTPPYGQRDVTFVAVTILGACIGFTRYNFKPARIFLGDNGSLLLGFLLAILMTLTGWSSAEVAKAIIIPCCVMAVPLYDITLSTILRIKNGVVKNLYQAIVYCGRDHLTHRFVALGLSQREAVLMLYLFGTISGAIGAIIHIQTVGPVLYMPIIALSLIALVVLGVILNRAKVYPEKSGEQLQS